MRSAKTFVHASHPGGHCTTARVRLWLLAAALVAGCSVAAYAQTSTDEKEAPPLSQPSVQVPEFSPGPVDIKSLPKNLFVDQKTFWTAPAHMTQKQWEWAVPLVIAGGALIVADNTIEKHAPTGSSTGFARDHSFQRGGCRFGRGWRRTISFGTPQP